MHVYMQGSPAHMSTEHMLHALGYRMTNGLNREFSVLIKSWGGGNVAFLHFHCEKFYFVRAKVLYI